jgi:hypothetical protein
MNFYKTRLNSNFCDKSTSMFFESGSLQLFWSHKYTFDSILMKYFKFDRINIGFNMTRSVSRGKYTSIVKVLNCYYLLFCGSGSRQTQSSPQATPDQMAQWPIWPSHSPLPILSLKTKKKTPQIPNHQFREPFAESCHTAASPPLPLRPSWRHCSPPRARQNVASPCTPPARRSARPHAQHARSPRARGSGSARPRSSRDACLPLGTTPRCQPLRLGRRPPEPSSPSVQCSAATSICFLPSDFRRNQNQNSNPLSPLLFANCYVLSNVIANCKIHRCAFGSIVGSGIFWPWAYPTLKSWSATGAQSFFPSTSRVVMLVALDLQQLSVENIRRLFV